MKNIALPVVAFAFALALGAGPASGVPDPCSLTLRLSPGEQVAAITDVASDAVEFTGYWNLSKPPALEGVVSFTASLSTGWVAWVSPNSFNLGAESEPSGNFTVTVVLPAGTRATSIGQLVVTGRLIVGAETCAQGQALGIVTPGPYFGSVNLEASTKVVEVAADGRASFGVRVWSTANFEVGSFGGLEFEGPEGLAYQNPGKLPAATANGSVAETNVTITVDASRLSAGVYPLGIFLMQPCPELMVCDGVVRYSSTTVVLVVPQRGIDSTTFTVIAGLAVAATGAALFWKHRRGSA